MDDNVIDIFQQINYDDRITKQEFHTYQPRSQTYDNNDEIRILIQHQDIYTLPSESYLNISGKIVGNSATGVTDFKFVTNAFAFLFDEIRYELNGVEIDKVRDVGITSLIKGILSYTPGDLMLANIAGFTDNHVAYNKETKNFYACIPLKHLLGFAEDYRKIVTSVKQELILLRSRTNTDSYTGKLNENKISIEKIEWRMPHVQLNDEIKLKFLDFMKTDKPVLVPFRKWELHELPALRTTNHDIWSVKTSNSLEKPRYVVLAFQIDKRDREEKNASEFDHCNIRNIKVYLNSESYPYDNLNLDIKKGDYLLAYHMYSNFQSSYYGKRNEPCLTFEQFSKRMVFVFDVSKQNESLKLSSIDLKIEIEANVVFQEKTRAYCLILCDSIIEYTPLSGLVRKIIT